MIRPDHEREARVSIELSTLRLPCSDFFLRSLIRALSQLVQFGPQTMAQRTLGTQLVEQLLGLGKYFIGAIGTAEKRSPRSCYLLFSKQATPLRLSRTESHVVPSAAKRLQCPSTIQILRSSQDDRYNVIHVSFRTLMNHGATAAAPSARTR
jgi:hypothetical protein